LRSSDAALRASRKPHDQLAAGDPSLDEELFAQDESLEPDLALDDVEGAAETLLDAYAAYSRDGGNRHIDERVLKRCDLNDIEVLDHSAQREVARAVFPDDGEHIWEDEVFGPITEVRKFWFTQQGPANGRRDRQWCAPDYHDSGERYPLPWGINQGYQALRDGREPAPLPTWLFRVRHLLGQPYGRLPRIDLQPYRKWVPQTEPKGPHPFELRDKWEALPLIERRRAIRARPPQKDQRWRYYNFPPRTMSRNKARLFLRDAMLANRRRRHDGPLGEIAKPTTPKQWEDYRLSQYTTARGDLKFGISPRVRSAKRPPKPTAKAFEQWVLSARENYVAPEPSWSTARIGSIFPAERATSPKSNPKAVLQTECLSGRTTDEIWATLAELETERAKATFPRPGVIATDTYTPPQAQDDHWKQFLASLDLGEPNPATVAGWKELEAREKLPKRKWSGCEVWTTKPTPTPVSPRHALRNATDIAVEKFLSEGGAISVLPTYYGYNAMERKRGRPRKPKFKLVRSFGRPCIGDQRMKNSEKQKRYRDKRNYLAAVEACVQVAHLCLLQGATGRDPHLQAWMCAQLVNQIPTLRKEAA
jgi:hypothetical protein